MISYIYIYEYKYMYSSCMHNIHVYISIRIYLHIAHMNSWDDTGMTPRWFRCVIMDGDIGGMESPLELQVFEKKNMGAIVKGWIIGSQWIIHLFFGGKKTPPLMDIKIYLIIYICIH